MLAEQPEPVVVGRAEYVPNPCVLHPERVTEHQWGDLLPYAIRERLDEWEDWEDEDAVSHQFDLSIPPGWRSTAGSGTGALAAGFPSRTVPW
ncbi:hypothetical protein [Streptomyces sp. S.PB5]|uniref:hypothetical protein n=1 Tax=Streptomyces sp. S.PB5 TaxID=3020844 RepID=UPI0025B16DB3|nr:hypothetical protein [Streptomyces sp. S.PB5]MDN3024659.1 hypothetical protein [Streptomyces sp. S.PB5]